MTRNPFLNAFAAAAYIVLIVFVIQTVTSVPTTQENLLIPITMLSLLVLSASVMGMLFFYDPFRLYFDNQKQEALIFFGKTIGCFAFFATFLVAVLFYSSAV